MGDERRVAVVREITKKFEETVRGTVAEVLAHFREHEPKGEFVIVVAGYDPKARNASVNEELEEEE
jgi:16S rRNA (cytidine1402-2'-O)-methyltransferase